LDYGVRKWSPAARAGGWERRRRPAPPPCALDIPPAHKDALDVRSHYDAMTLPIADAPRPHERVGGLRATEAVRDGLH
jgi:hypothetical protein